MKDKIDLSNAYSGNLLRKLISLSGRAYHYPHLCNLREPLELQRDFEEKIDGKILKWDNRL